MAEKAFTVLDLLEKELPGRNSLNLKCLGGRKGLAKQIKVPDINHPGIALSGFYESFAFECVQLFGLQEVAFLRKLYAENRSETVRRLFTFDIPCLVFTGSLYPEDDFLAAAEQSQCAVLQTDLDSTEFSMRLLRVFSSVFAPKKTLHGVLVEVYGIGIDRKSVV